MKQKLYSQLEKVREWQNKTRKWLYANTELILDYLNIREKQITKQLKKVNKLKQLSEPLDFLTMYLNEY